MTLIKLHNVSKNELISIEANNQTIYEAFEEKGITLAHGCLSGSCGACKIKIIEGLSNLKAMSAVEKDTVDYIKDNLSKKLNDPEILKWEIRLSCRAKFTGDLSFEII